MKFKCATFKFEQKYRNKELFSMEIGEFKEGV